MTFWAFLDRCIDRLPGWPSERQMVMFLTYALGMTMLIMARGDPKLWTVELYKTLITVVIVTGFVNMILSFHFAANKADEDKTNNTAAAFSAIEATARAAGADVPTGKLDDPIHTVEER
jgi:hypothetical protein